MLKLAALFGDNAVLQRDRAVPVWGWCAPFRRVRATLGDGSAETRSGADGKFLLRFPPMPSAVRLTLQVTELESGETATAQNIALGEVWLASGQSNMEFKVSSLADGGAELRRRADAGELDAVRMLTVPRNALLTPARDVDAAWQTASAATIDDWSAVALFFAKKLADELAVPVGVLASSWGGTIAEAWTSGETLARNPDIARAYSEYLLRTGSTEYWDSLSPEELEIPMRNFETALFTHLPPEPENSGFSAGWAESAYDDSNWDRTALPAQWKEFDLNTNGTVWFRRKVEIPAEWAGRELILTLGAVDKHDITYFDGVEVGRTGSGYDTSCWDVCRVYRIPSELVRPGLRVIAVRDYSFAYDGGLTGPASGMKLAPADAEREKISIAGEWSYKIETDLGPAFPHLSGMGLCCPNSFSILFDNMIRPLVPAALRGVIWYQGESNAIRFHQYERLMRDLIADWRFHFAQGDIPFLQVLLAGYRTAMDYDPNSEWAPIREAQSRAAAATGNLVASAVDAGDAADIHPKDKQTVGERLAATALMQAYGGKEEGSGPVFRSQTRSGDALLLSFDHAAGGLIAPDGRPHGFWIAGNDRVFKPAEAVIAGVKVAVSSPQVPEPVAVRYGWSDNPRSADLRNSAGLPALPFRTDKFDDGENE